MNIGTAFLSGILAAFTPCVVVLIPALVYRFSNNEKKPVWAISQFALSFVIVYILSALFLSELLSSSFRFGIQLGVGILFVVMGILALLKRFNPLQFQLIKQPWLFGLVFALLVSVNPCVFAYLGLLLGTTSSIMLPFAMGAFAIGILLPSVLVAVFGYSLLHRIRKAQKVLHHISTAMNWLLIAMGIYMIYTIKHLGTTDILVTGILLLITFVIILRSFFLIKKKPQFQHIILFIALLIILAAIVFHCDAHVKKNELEENNPFHIDNLANEQSPSPTCSSEVGECEVCQRCIIIFSIGGVLGFLAILFTHYFWKKK